MGEGFAKLHLSSALFAVCWRPCAPLLGQRAWLCGAPTRPRTPHPTCLGRFHCGWPPASKDRQGGGRGGNQPVRDSVGRGSSFGVRTQLWARRAAGGCTRLLLPVHLPVASSPDVKQAPCQGGGATQQNNHLALLAPLTDIPFALCSANVLLQPRRQERAVPGCHQAGRPPAQPRAEAQQGHRHRVSAAPWRSQWVGSTQIRRCNAALCRSPSWASMECCTCNALDAVDTVPRALK